jgi:hypothetical protein
VQKSSRYWVHTHKIIWCWGFAPQWLDRQVGSAGITRQRFTVAIPFRLASEATLHNKNAGRFGPALITFSAELAAPKLGEGGR